MPDISGLGRVNFFTCAGRRRNKFSSVRPALSFSPYSLFPSIGSNSRLSAAGRSRKLMTLRTVLFRTGKAENAEPSAAFDGKVDMLDGLPCPFSVYWPDTAISAPDGYRYTHQKNTDRDTSVSSGKYCTPHRPTTGKTGYIGKILLTPDSVQYRSSQGIWRFPFHFFGNVSTLQPGISGSGLLWNKTEHATGASDDLPRLKLLLQEKSALFQ